MDISTLRKGDVVTVFATVMFDVDAGEDSVHLKCNYSTFTAEANHVDRFCHAGIPVGGRAYVPGEDREGIVLWTDNKSVLIRFDPTDEDSAMPYVLDIKELRHPGTKDVVLREAAE